MTTLATMSRPIPRDAEYIRNRSKITESGCWDWERACTPNGYGTTTRLRARTPVPAHRLSYEIFKGSIPAGLQIDHLCFNRKCVNPDHLEAVTAQVNIDRKMAAGRHTNGRSAEDPCAKCGGPRVVVKISTTGKRFGVCKPCRSKYLREYRSRKGANDGR